MALPEWLRRLGKFLPDYGSCGGYSISCAPPPKPVDEMDELFAQHDMNLYSTNQLVSYYEREAARREADRILGQGLRKLDAKKLSLYGRAYRRFAMLIFRP